MSQVVVDFIARGEDGQPWQMVLVEQGPWSEKSIQENLHRIQDRLYGCIDAALDGQLAAAYPESSGQPIVIRLDCYGLPEAPTREFFENFSREVLKIEDYEQALKRNRFVKAIDFELNINFMM